MFDVQKPSMDKTLAVFLLFLAKLVVSFIEGMNNEFNT
jgi:hypothetical protein